MDVLRVVSVCMVLVGVSAKYRDQPLPLPHPNEVARSLQAWTAPEEDTVLAIERDLEQDLGLQHRAQVSSGEEEEEVGVGEFPKLITSKTGNLPGYKPNVTKT